MIKRVHPPEVLDFFIVEQVNDAGIIPQVINDLSSDHYPVLLNVPHSAIVQSANPTLMRYPFNYKLFSDTMTEITDTRIPLKTSEHYDEVYSVCCGTGKRAPGSAKKTTSLPLITPHQ